MSDNQAKARVQQQFGAAAAQYVDSPIHAHGDDLGRMVELAKLRGDERVLDVATGGGHTALAFAPHVRAVIATDLTPPMLAAAATFVRAHGAANVAFELADAEALPFPDASFDCVTVRIAPHHFPQPARFVQEVARVLRSGGLFIFNDNIAPDDAAQAMFLNRVEQWRDLSHVRCLSIHEWHTLMQNAGLTVVQTEPVHHKVHDFVDWTARIQLPAAERDALEAWMLSSPAALLAAFDVGIDHGRVRTFRGDAVIIVAQR